MKIETESKINANNVRRQLRDAIDNRNTQVIQFIHDLLYTDQSVYNELDELSIGLINDYLEVSQEEQ